MQLRHKQAVVADHLGEDCGEQDDDGDDDGDYVNGDDLYGDDADDNDVHRSHTDASPEAATKTCHPLQILFRTIHLAKVDFGYNLGIGKF